MEAIVTYIESTGQITCLGAMHDHVKEKKDNANNRNPREDVFIADLGNVTTLECLDWFVKEGKIQAKSELPPLTVKNGVITGIPEDTTVLWPDGVETVETKELEFDSNVSGVFTFRFTTVPYFPYTLEVQYDV